MIFFDATGQRWKKIKLSAAGVTVLAAAPALLLGIGILVYQPKWGHIPLISQAQDFVDQAASIATGQVAAATHPSPSPSPSASPKPTSRTAVKATARITPAVAATPAVLSAQTHPAPQASFNPHPGTTPATTPVPSSAPGNSGGHSKSAHSPKH